MMVSKFTKQKICGKPYEELYLFYQVEGNRGKTLFKKDVWKKLYKEKYTDVKLRRLTSDLTRLIEKFIIFRF